MDRREGRIRRRVVVRGQVQDVFFRASTRERARSSGADGWVRNCRDGSVEAVFEGHPEAVDECIRFCHTGPTWARVDAVEVLEEEPEGLNGFRVR